ncbi:MAG: OadG family protein [Chloroflexota bacterium]
MGPEKGVRHMVDWGLAGRIGGIGFATVFVVLSVLALAVWLTGIVVQLTSRNREAPKPKRE